MTDTSHPAPNRGAITEIGPMTDLEWILLFGNWLTFVAAMVAIYFAHRAGFRQGVDALKAAFTKASELKDEQKDDESA